MKDPEVAAAILTQVALESLRVVAASELATAVRPQGSSTFQGVKSLVEQTYIEMLDVVRTKGREVITNPGVPKADKP
jgi:hypothetical protein